MLKILLSFSFIVLISYFKPQNLQSSEFSISEIDDNIFVHFGIQEDSNKTNKGDIANIGFIVGEKSVLVIDTGGTQKIAKNLLKKIKEKTSLPISHVVITHGHPDHYLGSSIFKNLQIPFIGHENLERSINMNFNFYKALQASNIEDKSILDIKPVFPDIKIKKNKIFKINLGNREIEIRAWNSGHTDSDLTIFDSRTLTLWTENIFVGRTPSIRASIIGWKKNLEEIQKIKIKQIVPGHGRVRRKEVALKPMFSYFERIINEVRQYHLDGKNIESAQENIAKDNLENWKLYKEYHQSNITKAYSELEWE
ncbi:MAG: hypothetical protein CMP25_03270 [Rickettsiales bacterium]|nr:hypothetical protein [Rickettsiales bacterium]